MTSTTPAPMESTSAPAPAAASAPAPVPIELLPAPLRRNPDLTSMSSSIFTPITEDLTAPIDVFSNKVSYIQASIDKLDRYTDLVRGNMINMAHRDVKLVMRATKEYEINSPELSAPTTGLTEAESITVAKSLRAKPIHGKTTRNVIIVPNVEMKLDDNVSLREKGTKTVLILAEKTLSQLKGFREHAKESREEWQSCLADAQLLEDMSNGHVIKRQKIRHGDEEDVTLRRDDTGDGIS